MRWQVGGENPAFSPQVRRGLQGSNAAPYALGELTRRAGASQFAEKSAGVPRRADGMWVRNNKGNVFVGNLPPDFSDERLAEAFDPYGIVLTAVVARDPDTGARLRYGFVDIATDRAATKAITALHGSEIDGCKLNVKPRDKAPKKATNGARRPPMRGAPPQRAIRTPADAPPRPHTPSAEPIAAEPAPAARKLSQSEMAREAADAAEPPPRRDFEVVRRPLRRKEPSFQVERRSLPRRV
jgi:hypothetical protein